MADSCLFVAGWLSEYIWRVLSCDSGGLRRDAGAYHWSSPQVRGSARGQHHRLSLSHDCRLGGGACLHDQHALSGPAPDRSWVSNTHTVVCLAGACFLLFAFTNGVLVREIRTQKWEKCDTHWASAATVALLSLWSGWL